MCPPGHASSRDPFPGRHTGRPLRSRSKYPSTPEERAGTEPRPYRSIVVRSSGPMYLRHGFRRPNFVPKFGASVIGIGPYENTKRRRSRHDRPGQWRRVKRLRRGCKERVGITAEIIPKVSSNLGQSLSRPLGDSSLYTREPFPAGDGRTPPGHWDSQQRQTGRDRARPLQKGGEYAEG